MAARPPWRTSAIRRGIHARLGAEDERLGDRLDDDRDHDLVADLDDLAGARGSDVDDGLAHRLEGSGRARSKAAAVPPTMIERVPAIAPLSPPLTGASSISAPAGRGASSASSRAVAGAIELMSIASQPGRRRLERAVGPEVDLAHLGRVGEHRDEDVGRRRDAPRGVPGGRALGDELVDRARSTSWTTSG